MSTNQGSTPAVGFIEKAEAYFKENRKSLSIIGGTVVFLVVAFVAYLYLYKQPLEQEAREQSWKAEYWFEIDSFNLAINGNEQYLGFQQIVDEYDGTEAGDHANYYLGICYLNTGEFELAIEYLERVDFGDQIVTALAIGGCGDAYMELGEVENAIDKYEEAAAYNNNLFTSPLFLKKAGLAYEELGNFEKAAEIYQRIYDDYETSTEARDIEKYLYRAKNTKSAVGNEG